MSFKRIAVLRSEKSWFTPYAKTFIGILKDRGYIPRLFHKYITKIYKGKNANRN